MNASIKDARIEAWRRGRLGWLLRPYQRVLRDIYLSHPSRLFAAMWSRRIGKTFTLLTLGVETALANKRVAVKYAYPTLKQAKRVVVPTMREVLDNQLCPCPKELRPKFNAADLIWEFPNGSTITLGGCDHEAAADALRGVSMDFGIVDEAGFIPILSYVLNDVLGPQTLTTRGKIGVISSPPVSPAHSFVPIFRQCENDNAASHYDVWVAEQWLGREEIEKAIANANRLSPTAARREYGAEIVTDVTRAIVPEFDVDAEAEIVRDSERPDHCFFYTVGDFGFTDLTVVLFAYYDFNRAKLVVEDEITINRASGIEISEMIVAKEKSLWPHRPKPLRLADADVLVLQDIVAHSGLEIGQPNKLDAEAALNSLRMAISRRDIEINPRCKTLIDHLKYGVWNEARTSFDRDGEHGHFDAIDALKYMWRHVDRQSNPYPVLAKGVTNATHFIRNTTPNAYKRHNDLRKAFGV